MTKKSSYCEQIQDFNFKQVYHSERNAKIKVKLLALHHFQTGKSIKEVSDVVLATEKTVSSWIKDYIEFDYEGLIEREGRGRKP
jgi:transposase